MLNSALITPLNVFLAWLTIVSLILFIYSAYKLHKANKKINSKTQNEDKRLNELEQKALHDYQEIISNANRKASEIISQATQVNKDSKTSYESSVATLLQNQKNNLNVNSEAISKQHQQEIKELNQKIITLLTNVYKDIETSTKADFEPPSAL